MADKEDESIEATRLIERLSGVALQHHRARRLEAAERLYRDILTRNPLHVPTLHNLSVLARQTGRDGFAAALLRQAIALDDQAAPLHGALGGALRGLGELDQAAASYRRAADLQPDYLEAQYNLGNILRQLGRLDEAAACYRHAIALKSDLAEAHYNLGNILLGQGQAAEAAASFERAVAARPDWAEAHNNLGNALKDQGRLEAAAAAYGRALALKPDVAETHNNLANTYMAQGRWTDAAAGYRRTLALKPDHAEAHNNLGVVLARHSGLDEAIAAHERTLALQPDHAEAHYNLGNAFKDRGDLDRAAASYQQAITLQPGHAGAHYHLAGLGPTVVGSPEAEAAFAVLSRQVEDIGSLAPKPRAQLLFAMAKTLEDRGEFDRAFDYLARANAAQRADLTFDIAEVERQIGEIAQVFDRPFLERRAALGLESRRPVFIVGMPRSGSTLVEQIISAHPAVYGAGEILNLPEAVASAGGGALYPSGAAGLGDADWRAIGETYLASLPAAAGQERVTDKLLSNFQRLGLIHIVLPQTPIIHCRRDPRDTCLSAFGIHFRDDGLDYAYDLGELGRYWRAYDALMDHWRSVLPRGRMLEVPYEGLVEDPETWTRRLIAYCGLPWDDACLRFHQSGREVRTASAAQVRRPIYTGSVGRWRRFKPHLTPLLDALGVS